MTERDEKPRLIDRVRARQETHRERGRIYRIGFAVLGFLVVLSGILLSLPGIPGPGVLIVAIGLGMLALEFAWAERLLERVLDQLEGVGEATRRATAGQKAAFGVVVAATAAGAAAAAVLWDVPVLPV